MLQKGDTDGAIRFFDLNTRLFPASSNVWDSLGEAYMRSGRRKEAIANYRKALAIDPHNANAEKMLHDLESTQK